MYPLWCQSQWALFIQSTSIKCLFYPLLIQNMGQKCQFIIIITIFTNFHHFWIFTHSGPIYPFPHFHSWKSLNKQDTPCCKTRLVPESNATMPVGTVYSEYINRAHCARTPGHLDLVRHFSHKTTFYLKLVSVTMRKICKIII